MNTAKQTLQTCIVALGLLSAAGSLNAANSTFAEAAPALLQAYIQIDTINPPGNESRGVAYLAKQLDKAGIPYETSESAPGRGNLWARLPGGDKPALVLLHHIDVVPADAAYWDVDPMAGIEKDGYIWGRGAIDTKGLGIIQLQAFLALHASGETLNRDVILMATADEEAGGFFGADHVIKHHPEVFENVGFLVNEGGSGRMSADGRPVFRIEVTQKVPMWLRLTATDIPGHGSYPRPTSAVTRILRAGHRVADTSFDFRVVPAVDTMLKGLAEFEDEPHATRYKNMRDNITDHRYMAQLHLEKPGTAALLHNTCSVTTLQGSNKINVVPPTASLELDCRMLPDQNPAEFLEQLTLIINDPQIEIEQIMAFSPAVSATDTPLFAAIEKTLKARHPDVKIVPSVATGFTDSHFFRDLGIVSYGFSTFLFGDGESTGVHGNNERILVDNMVNGTDGLIEFLNNFTVD